MLNFPNFNREQTLRMLAAVAGIAVGGNGLELIEDTEAMAPLMGLPRVDDASLAALVGNLGLFLLLAGAMAICGAWIRSPVFLYCAAALVGCVAGFRILVSIAGSAAISAGFVAVEFVVLALWLTVGVYLQRRGGFILPAPGSD